MSKTLFWYVFRDLFRIFFMAAGALAGIMSFGGLLRPLTEHGLDSTQVSKMLGYLTPAMMSYSFPVAALFAATMVYGRLSADNELTACRAGGISFLSMTTPAIVLGLGVALVSLVCLCFVVPVFTLRAEKVVYSNLAQLVQNQIERTHQIEILGHYNVFAQSARVMEPDPEYPGAQRLELIGPMIVTYTIYNPNRTSRLAVGTEFYMAKRAYAYIDQNQGDDVKLTVKLENPSHFERNTATTKQAVEMTEKVQTFGPITMPSPVKEDAKFMTIDGLKYLYENPEASRKIQADLQQQIKDDQSRLFLEKIRRAVRDDGVFRMETEDQVITLTGGDLAPDIRDKENILVLQSSKNAESRQVKLTRLNKRGGTPAVVQEVREMRLRATPRWDINDAPPDATIDLSVQGFDVVIRNDEDQARHNKFGPTIISLPMPKELAALRGNTVSHYLEGKGLVSETRERLKVGRTKLLAKIQSEIHGRASFAISCFVLVMVGCSLGMLFRTSNFLDAFAVSFIPAMFSVALIVTGQQVCSHARNSTALGLGFIWGGNGLVLILAMCLIAKLQRT